MNTQSISRVVMRAVICLGLSAVAFAEPSPGVPASVPVKVWVTGDVGAFVDPFGNVMNNWSMSLEGDFQPTQPSDALQAYTKYMSGADKQVTETTIGLNAVPCLPFQSVTVQFTGYGFYSGKFCVAAPPGYKVLIDNQECNSTAITGYGAYAAIQTITFDVRVVPSDIGPQRPAGTATSFGTGRVDLRISLGDLKSGDYAGEIALLDPGWGSTWQSLWSGHFLLTVPEYQEATRDGNFVLSNETCVQVAPVDSTSYELRFYTPSQVTGTGATRTATGDPFVVYKVARGSTDTSLLVTKTTRNVTDATSTNSPIARVETTSLIRTGTWPSFVWTVTDWTIQGGTSATQIVEQDGGTTANRTAHIQVKSGTSVVSDLTAHYTLYPWGEGLTSIEQNAGTEILTTTINYGSDTTDVGFNSYGNPVSKTLPNGNWEYYEYISGADDRTYAGIVMTINRPYKGLPTTPSGYSTNSAKGEEDTYGFSQDMYGFPTRPMGITHWLDGAAVERTGISYANEGLIMNTLQVLAANRSEYYGNDAYNISDKHLNSTVKYFREDTADPFFRKKTHSITRPDGTKTSYAYQRGYWDGSAFHVTDNHGVSASFSSNPPGPVGSRIAAINGIVGDTYTALADGYDIDDIGLVEDKSTMDVTIRDDRALVCRAETYVWHSGDWNLVKYVNYTHNFVGQPSGSVSSTGATTEVHYNGDSKDYEIDERGVRTNYSYDEAGRVQDVVRVAGAGIKALTTRYTYDAANRILQEQSGTLSGSQFSGETLTSTHSYDTAGRLVSETSPGVAATNYSYNTATSTRTISYPNGGMRVEASYIEGRLKSVTGTAVVPEYYTYDVAPQSYYSDRYTRVNYGSANSTRLQETWTDMLGRTYKTSKPGFTGQAAYVEESIYDDINGSNTGHLLKTTRTGYVDTLYEYDEMGQIKRSGLKFGTGTLATGSTDRITERATSYENTSGAWWIKTVEKTYPTNNTDTALTVSTTRRRLSNFGGTLAGFAGSLQAEEQTTDVHGQTTVVQTFVDRNSAQTKVVTTVPGLTNPQVRTYSNGQLTSVTQCDGLTYTTDYDALLRAYTNTDPRTGTTTTHYLGGSTLVDWIQDPAGNYLVRNTYDSAGRVTVAKDAADFVTNTDYNKRNQAIRQWGTGCTPVEYAYNTLGERIAMRTFRATALNFSTTWAATDDSLDESNTPDPASWTQGDKVSWTFDGPSGLLSTKTYPAADPTSSQSALNQPKSVTFTYNSRGQVTQRTWARGTWTKYHYFGDSDVGGNGTGELQWVEYSDSTPQVTYTYTRAGMVSTITDGTVSTATGTRTFNYGVTGASPTSEALEMDSVTLSAFYGGRELTEKYDAYYRPIGFKLGDGYDSSAALSQLCTYSTLGRFDHLDTSRNGQTAHTITYSYYQPSAGGAMYPLVGGYSVDSTFNVVRTYEPTRDLLSSIDSQWSGVSQTKFAYTYNALGQRATAKQSGNLFAVATDIGGPTYYRYLYTGRGEMQEAVDYYGDDVSRTDSPQLIGRRFGYEYDNAGNRQSATRALGTAVKDVFIANAVNQYSSRENDVTYTAGTANAQSSISVSGATTASNIGRAGNYWAAELTLNNYLPVGSPPPAKADITVTASLSSGGTTLVRSGTRTAYTAPSPQSFTYDEDGNLTADGLWNYTYDAENRLTTATTTTMAVNAGFPNRTLGFKYDDLGRRVEKHSLNTTVGTETWVRYLYHGDNLVAEFDAPSGTSCGNLLRSYTWGLDLSGSLSATGGVGALVQIADASGTQYFPTYDGNGNVVALLRASDGLAVAKYEYSPFGELLRCDEPAAGGYAKLNPFRFSTKYTDDETGFVYYGARYYAPSLGRFINRDPIEEAGGLNLYGFCGSDGVNRFDVLGHGDDTVILPKYPVNGDRPPTLGNGPVIDPSTASFTATLPRINITLIQDLNPLYNGYMIPRAYRVGTDKKTPRSSEKFAAALKGLRAQQSAAFRAQLLAEERASLLFQIWRYETTVGSKPPDGSPNDVYPYFLGDGTFVGRITGALVGQSLNAELGLYPIGKGYSRPSAFERLMSSPEERLAFYVEVGGMTIAGEILVGFSGSAELAADSNAMVEGTDAVMRGGNISSFEGNVPDPVKWIKKGGKYAVEPDGSVVYTNPSGLSVPYSDTGYPDFGAAGQVRQEVQIEMQGNYTTDFSLSDRTAPLGPRLEGNTWHHNEDMVRMQEMNSDVHGQFPHSGGVSNLKK